MFLMSSSTVLTDNLIFVNRKLLSPNPCFPHNRSKFVVRLNCKRGRRLCRLIPNAKKNHNNSKRSWWQRFLFVEEGNWFGLKDDDLLEDELESSKDEELSEDEKFEEWKRRAEAIVELREAQEDMRNEESRRWEDWLVDGNNNVDGTSSWEWDDRVEELRGDGLSGPGEMVPEKGLVELVRDVVLGRDNDEILYEDRVFRYASLNSAKFLAVLIIIPWALDFIVHDYVLMPFLDRYVKLVPLAAEMLDVRKHQKLEMVKELKVERARFRFEVEIGKSPPLSDDEIWVELREKALELRDEWRLENRKAFASIWSDMAFGITLFVLLYFNQSKVALLKFTGYKILNNISAGGKAFLIILIADILVGYHSEVGWSSLSEAVVEHYGLEVDQAAITIFVSIVPIIDVFIKFWLFKVLPGVSPKVSRLVERMTRH